MYRVDRRSHRHKRARRRFIVLLSIALTIAVIYILLHLRITPKQDVHNTAPLSQNYAAAQVTKVHVDKPLFTMELPSGWKERSAEVGVIPKAQYSFQSPGAPAQLLAMYVDAIPTAMAVNHAIVVSAQGDGLAYDTVSGNCTTFTDSSKTNQQTKVAQAKWQNIDFLCDMGNYNRGVIGTESTEGINQVTVTGPAKGSHKLFIRYTDNSINPDHTTLYAILGGLHFK